MNLRSSANNREPAQNFWEWLTEDSQKDPSRHPARKTKSPRGEKKHRDPETQSRSPHKRPRTKSHGRVTEESRRRRRKPTNNKQPASKSESRLQRGSRRQPRDSRRRQRSALQRNRSSRNSGKGLTGKGLTRDPLEKGRSHTRSASRSASKRRKPSRNVQKSEETILFLKEVLNREIVFQRFGPEVIDEVIAVMYKLNIKAQETMIRQGEVGDTYHVVEQGHFHIRVKESSGVVKLVAEALRGNAIGDASLFYNTPRRATLEAAEDSVVWALDASEFRKIRQRWSQRENAKLEKIRNLLKKFPLFKSQTTEELTNAAKTLKEESFDKGETIISQGDIADKFYVLRKGEANVLKSSSKHPHREPVLVNQCKPGDFFGERGIILAEPRAASVIATADCRCFMWDAANFSKVIAVGNCEPIFYQAIESYKEIEESEETPWVNRLATKLDEYINLGVLGVGSFGRVSLVKEPYSKKTWSLKSVRKNRVVETGQQEHMKNERLVMTLINSDFTVRLMATYQDEHRVFFLMEAVLGGELFTVLRFNRKFSERTAKFYAGCCVAAFEHMHSLNILYRDLKPENLLLTDKGYIKLTDFGFAKKRNNTSTLCGTPEYLAPEVIRNWTQGFAVDWWTLGILIYEMIVSNPPFDDDDGGKKMYEKILSSAVKYPRTVSRTARDLIDKLLKKNAYQRLGAAPNGSTMVKRHPWWKNFDWDALFNQTMETPYIPRIRDREDLSNYESYPEEDIKEPLCADPDSDVFAWTMGF